MRIEVGKFRVTGIQTGEWNGFEYARTVTLASDRSVLTLRYHQFKDGEVLRRFEIDQVFDLTAEAPE